MRALVLVLALAAVACGVAVLRSLLAGDPVRPAVPAEPPAAAAPVAPGERPRAPRPEAPRAAAAPAGAPERVAAPDEASTGDDAAPHEPPLTDGVRVRVVRAADGEPVAGATVLWVTSSSFTEDDMQRAIARGINLERFLTRYARRFRSDDSGELFVPPSGDDLVLAGSRGELWGMLEVDSADLDELAVLALVPDPSLRARVVDDAGRPVAGVPVALGFGSEDHREDILKETTDSDGLAEIPHVGTFAAQFQRQQSLLLAASVLAAEDRTVEVDAAALPAEPFEIVVPALGWLELELVDGEGHPLDDAAVVELEIAPSTPVEWDRRGSEIATVVERRARVPIGLDLVVEVRARVQGLEDVEVLVHGPTSAGEVVPVRLELTAPTPRVVGVLLDADGAPVASARLDYRLVDDPGEEQRVRGRGFRTDARGGFSIEVDDDWRGGPRELVLVHRPDPSEPPREAAADLSFELAPGPNDLGPLVLDAVPRIADGRVVDESGLPVGFATVRLERGEERRRGDRTWTHWRRVGIEALTASDGSFELSGRVDRSADYRVVAHRSGYARFEGLPIALGARELLLRLRAAGSLAGTLLVDTGVEIETLEVVVAREDDGEEAARRRADAQGRYEVGPLVPGSHRVAVRVRGTEDDLAAAAGVVVAAGTEAAVAPLDLRGALRTIRVSVFDADGRPAEELRVVAAPAGSGEFRLPAHGWRGHERTVATTDRAVDLRVAAPGHRIAELWAVSDDVEVTLEPGARVRLVLAGGAPELPPGTTLRAWIESDAMNELGAFFGEPPAFDASGAAEAVLPGPGEYRAHVYLVAAGGAAHGFQEPFPFEVGSGDPTVTVDLDRGALAGALAEAAGD